MISIDEQKTLIDKLVRANKNFKGNEDLFEDFCSESLQKSYMIFNSCSNVNKIENYVSKVVHTSMLSVLKDSGRVRRTKEGYVPTREIKESELNSTPHTLKKSFVFDFPDPKDSMEETLITKDCLQKIADAVCIIHKEVPSQLFLDIFYWRYMKGVKQAEIAQKLNLSQSEVSKRLMQLSKLISNFLDGSGNS